MTAIALITGASGGIGRVLARQLHAQGCRVAAVGRPANRLADVEAAVHIGTDTTRPKAQRRPSPPARKPSALHRRFWRTAWAAR
jgi:NAD(P)-dependent dehydrogenase (short-subunit alcohol dehydrogenase family)